MRASGAPARQPGLRPPRSSTSMDSCGQRPASAPPCASTVSPSRPQASSIAADAVDASATARHAGHAGRDGLAQLLGLFRTRRDRPPTSSRTNGPITWKRGVNACATSTNRVDRRSPETRAAPQTRPAPRDAIAQPIASGNSPTKPRGEVARTPVLSPPSRRVRSCAPFQRTCESDHVGSRPSALPTATCAGKVGLAPAPYRDSRLPA